MKIRNILCATMLAGCFIGTAAHAQSTNTNTTTQGATGSLTSNAYNQVLIGGMGSSGGSGGGKQVVSYEGPGGIPSGTAGMGSPYIMSANPCTLENGGSAVGGPFGISVALSHTEHGCVMVRDSGAMNSMGQRGVAIIQMCTEKDTAFAFFHQYGLICPGAKKPEQYHLEDLGVPGIKGTPAYAIIDPYNGHVLNIARSPILGPYLAQALPAPQVVAMAPVTSKGDPAASVASVWQKRMNTGSMPLPH